MILGNLTNGDDIGFDSEFVCKRILRSDQLKFVFRVTRTPTHAGTMHNFPTWVDSRMQGQLRNQK